MSRAEDYANARLDRQKDKAQTSARTLQVRELAKATINCAVMEMPEDDRAEFMNASIRHLRTLYGATEGQHSARNLFASLSKTPESELAVAVAKARAEQLGHRLFQAPANDPDTLSRDAK